MPISSNGTVCEWVQQSQDTVSNRSNAEIESQGSPRVSSSPLSSGRVNSNSPMSTVSQRRFISRGYKCYKTIHFLTQNPIRMFVFYMGMSAGFGQKDRAVNKVRLRGQGIFFSKNIATFFESNTVPGALTFR